MRLRILSLSLFGLGFLLLNWACNGESETEVIRAHLVFDKQVSIPITDEVALASIAKFCFVEIDGQKCFSLMEDAYKLIQIYALDDFSLKKEIRIKDCEYESYCGSYMIHNLDSIFLLDYTNSRLYMIDSEGNTEMVINIRTDALLGVEQQLGNPHVPYPMDAFNSYGFEYYEGKVFLASSGMESVDYTKNLREIFVIDLANDSVYMVMNKPNVYFEGYWGPHLLHNFQFIYNANKNEFVIGYGVDHDIYATCFKSPPVAHSMRSKHLNKMKPFGKKKPSHYAKSPEIEKYSITNGFYSRLYYDSYAQ